MDMPQSFKPLCQPFAVRLAEDSYVDVLLESAPTKGAVLLSALFPRAFIDPNRAPNDIDPRQIEGTRDLFINDPVFTLFCDVGVWPGVPLEPSEKSKHGLGLIRQFIVPGTLSYIC